VEPIDLADYLDWGGGASRKRRGFLRDIAGSVVGVGRSINEKPGANMSKYFEVRPLWAEPE
jgi:hypothetical protein